MSDSRIGLGPEWVWREGVGGSPMTGMTDQPDVETGPGVSPGSSQAGLDVSAEATSEAAAGEPDPDAPADSHQEPALSLSQRLSAVVSVVLLSAAAYARKRWER